MHLDGLNAGNTFHCWLYSCIIVYVTNKAHLSLILLLAKICFLSAAIGARGRTVQEHSVYACKQLWWKNACTQTGFILLNKNRVLEIKISIN